MMKFDFEITIENYQNDLRKLYTMFRPHVELDEINECSEIEVGFANSIVKMNDLQSNVPVVVRVNKLRMLISMSEEQREKHLSEPALKNLELETEILRQASELGITAKLYATFKNGFISKFVEGAMSSFESYDREVARQTAIKIAKFHQIRLDPALLSSKPLVYKFMGRAGNFELMMERRVRFDKQTEESEFEELRIHLPRYSSLCDELERLHELIVEKDAYGPLCLCHNDLQTQNLLIDRQTKEPILIDFEWSNTNFRNFDIAYHLFCLSYEFCKSFKVEHVPSPAFIRHWLRSYYEQTNRMDHIQMTENELEQLVEKEVKKVLVNMLLIRILMIQRALTHIFNFPEKISIEAAIKQSMQLYEDFLRNRDQHMKLLDTLKN